jgi:hypothetical protein
VRRVTYAVIGLVGLLSATVLLMPRPLWWSVTASLPLFPWEQTTIDACSAPSAGLLRKLVYRSEDASCLPEWWAADVPEARREALGTWFTQWTTDETLRPRDHWRAALVAQSLGVDVPAVVGSRAVAARDRDRFARQVLWNANSRELDPDAWNAAAASAWTHAGRAPESAESLLESAASGWLIEPGLGHVARSAAGYTGELEEEGRPGLGLHAFEDAEASFEALCEAPETSACLFATAERYGDHGMDRIEAALPGTADAWLSFEQRDPSFLAHRLAAWDAWSRERPDDVAASLLSRLERAVGAKVADPMAIDGAASRGPWTTALWALWVGEVTGVPVEVARRPGELLVTVAGRSAGRADCGAPLSDSDVSFEPVGAREVLALAAWERGRTGDAAGWSAWSRRLAGEQTSTETGPAGRVGALLAPRGSEGVRWPSCG